MDGVSHWATREVPQMDYQILFISEKIHICLGSSDLSLFTLFLAGFLSFIHILFGECHYSYFYCNYKDVKFKWSAE